MYATLKKIRRVIKRRIRASNSKRNIANRSLYGRFWVTLSIACTIVFASFLFPMSHLFAPPSTPQVGDIADSDIYAPFDFPVFKGQAELEYETRQTLESLPAIVIYDDAIVDSTIRSLNRLFYLADSLKSRVGNSTRVADKLRLFFPQMQLETLQKLAAWKNFEAIDSIILISLQERYIVGVAPADSMIPPTYSKVIVKRGSGEKSFAADQVLSLQKCKQKLLEDIQIHSGDYIDDAKIFYDIGKEFLVPNLSFSASETEQRRDAALASITKERTIVRSGQRILARNEPVTKTHVEWLNALALFRAKNGAGEGVWQFLLPILARLVFVSFVVLSFIYSLYYLRGREILVFHRIFPLLLIIMLTLASSYFITEQGHLPFYLVPVGAGIILSVVLYDLQIAIFTTFAEALLLGILYEFDFETSFIVVITGIVAAFSMREVQKRSDFYRCALYVAIVLGATAFVLESLEYANSNLVMTYCGYGVANALVSAFIAMALLPLFETLFAFTTNITLLELSDLNHPLLKRLAIEAPGTYHHSLVLGNLSEAAAKSIGANSLLARVGTYYHDIGKMEISEYFVENQFGLKSKHDELTPSMSALVISSHIKRGRELAEENDLPDKIIEFIEEHHGTSVMTYFYNKAKEQSTNGDTSEEEYRYPGPKPQSKETAILMIADSVEAASRTLDDPKPARIRSLIKRISTDKFQSGQLSDSNLTLADLQGIEEAFALVLIGAFHNRIDYPRVEKEKSGQ